MNDPSPLVFEPTTLQLFRFSAATWNPHLIHYDREYAQTEGYPDVLVQSHLHGCFLVEVVRRWARGEASYAASTGGTGTTPSPVTCSPAPAASSRQTAISSRSS